MLQVTRLRSDPTDVNMKRALRNEAVSVALDCQRADKTETDVTNRLRATFLSATMVAALAAPASAQPTGGLLWKDRPNLVVKDDERHERSLAPVILSGVAGSVMGLEIAVVTAGIAAGATASWWVLGGAGAVVGAVTGALAGEYYFNAVDDKKPSAEKAAQSASGLK